MEKEDLLRCIQEKVKNNNIRFPSQINFHIDNGILFIRIKKDAVCNNMQTDGAAFEGWAICIKSWLPEIVGSFVLGWERPQKDMSQVSKKNNNKRLHYHRFLYRALRFSEFYEWCSISEDNIAEIEDFKKELTGLQNNSFSEKPGIKGINIEGEKSFKLSETIIEYLLANDLSAYMKKQFNLEVVDRQFPVGVKKNNAQFFTGSMSAIDLWGTKGDILTIIELKYNGGDSKNIKVGIISELFMYSCIMKDILEGIILPPNNTPIENEKDFYIRHKEFKHIVARMLSDKYHPLLENDQVLSLMNQNRTMEENIDIKYYKTTYQLFEMI